MSRPPVATLEGVSHRYGKTLALQDLTLEIPAGCMVGLIGPDGVGKSTLMGLLAGARRLQTGRLQVLGSDMADAASRDAACPRIAYMPQGLGKNLYMELSIRENLDFFARLFAQPAKERARRIDRLTRATGLHPFLDRPAGKLSGGMKQKVGLCCALIHDPDLLILDEPTTGVDPLSRRQFWDLIDHIRTEHPTLSVLVSTAYMDEAERFDWTVVMDEGRVLATGTPEGLRATHGVRTLEEAFVALLPEEKRSHARDLVIPPLEADDEAPAIVATHLSRRFGDFTAVDDVSFSIRPGEIFGFLGSNGCGKTTTMKMLTGLLPASEGEARLFGHPVAAGDMATRRRVGYMSQLFSLYGELTVAQNLALHARLFHLTAEETRTRLDDLVPRFGLTPYLGQVSEELPLGVRQRLSLAVALIHKPDMLILDEPTSGVDPVARDAFWELLIDLSRREKVTIFLSTHFMNEAQRCDRISLMHAGRVLAQGAPADLQASRGAESLEAAFIRCIEEAEGPEPAAPTEPVLASPEGSHATARGLRAAFQRLLAYSHRELLEVLRDPVRLAFAFLGSTLLCLVFGFGISTDVEHVRFAALDLDQTPQSRAYLQAFSGTGETFQERPSLLNAADLEARMRTQDISVAVELPPDFGRTLQKGGHPEVLVHVDGSNPQRAETLQTYVEGAHRTAMERLGQPKPPLRFESRFCYNPTFESIRTMVPSVIAMLLVLIPSILMAVSVVREKELGSITNFYVTPTRRLEFLLGKQLPYLGIALLNFGLLVLIATFLFQVPLKGSLLALTVGALLYVMATTGFGLLVSSLTSSQVAAVIGTSIVSLLATLQFSGMLQPVSTLQGGARIMGQLWPTSYFMHASVGVFTKGLGFSGLMPDLVRLALFIPVFTGLSALALRKQEA